MGCTKAGVPEVGFLSLTLPSLKSTFDSPFEQDMHDQGYIILRGECPATVTGFKIQLNDSAWVAIPQEDAGPSGAEESPAGSYGWDQDCADGTFTFWLYEHDLAANFPQFMGDDNGPSVIRLIGTGTVNTSPLEFYDTWSDDGDGTPSKLSLQAYTPNPGYIVNEQCTELSVGLLGEHGHRMEPQRSYRFSLVSSLSGWASVTEVYGSWNDCYSNQNSFSGNDITLPANVYERRLYVKLVGTLGDGVKLQVSDVESSLTASEIFESTLTDINNFFGEHGLSSIIAGTCYPFQVVLHDYSSSYPYMNVLNDPITVTMGGSAVNADDASSLEVYSDLTSCNSGTGGSNASAYSQQIPKGQTMTPLMFIRAPSSLAGKTLTLTAVLADGVRSFDESPRPFFVDEISNGVVTKTSLNGPNVLTTDQCQSYTVGLMNKNHVPIPASGAMTIPLTGPGQFYANSSDCWNELDAVTGVIIADGETSKEIHFRPKTAGRNPLRTSHAGLENYGFDVSVADVMEITGCEAMYFGDSACQAGISGGVGPYTITLSYCSGGVDDALTVTTAGLFTPRAAAAGSNVYCSLNYSDSEGRMGYSNRTVYRSPVLMGNTVLQLGLQSYFTIDGGVGPFMVSFSAGDATITNQTPGSLDITANTLDNVTVNVCDDNGRCGNQIFTVQQP